MKQLRDFKELFFDLDGTILDSADMIVASLEVAFRTHFGQSPKRSALIAGIGTPLAQQLAHHASEFGHHDPNLVNKLIESYLSDNLARHDQEMKIFPNAKEVIMALVERGHRLTIVTSKPVKTARRGLSLFGLDHVFKLALVATLLRNINRIQSQCSLP